MRSFRVYLFFLFVSITILSFGQVLVSYNGFISNLKTFNPQLKAAINLTQIGQLQVDASRGGFDPVLTSNYENKFYAGSNYYSILDAKLKQAIFSSHYVSLGYQYAQGDFLNPENRTSNQGLPFLGFETSLLQGFAFDKRRSEVLKAEGYAKYLEAEKNDITNQFLSNASAFYFEWIFSTKELLLIERFTNLAKVRFESIKQLVELEELAVIDSVEASILYQNRLLDLQTIQIENQKSSNSILASMWKNDSETFAETTVLKENDSLEVYYARAKLGIKNSIDVSVLNPKLVKFSAQNSILEVDKRFKRELIKPKLDLSYNFLSGNTQNFSPSFNANNYKWGVQFSMPLLLRTSRNEFEISKIRIENNNFEFQNVLNILKMKESVCLQNLEVIDAQIVLSQSNVSQNLQLVEAEKLKFEQGESSLFLLNTRESKWLESELKLAGYMTKYILTVLEYKNLKGTLEYEF